MPDPHVTKHLTLNVHELISGFLIDRRASQVSPATLEFYSGELAKFLFRLEYVGISELHEIDADLIRAHLLELSTHRNAGGVHARYRAIRAWLNWCWDELELELRNPITRVTPPKVKSDPLPGITLDDIFKMLTVCKFSKYDVRDSALLLCLLDTGARASEFVSIDWPDINLLTGDVHIRSGKGGKSRMVHVGKRASKALRAWQRIAPNTDAVWTSQTDERLTVSGVRQILRRRARDAGIKECGAHDFRRACLLGMLRNGADPVTVSRYAGHADVRVTMRYLAQNNDDLRDAHARTSPVDNWGN